MTVSIGVANGFYWVAALIAIVAGLVEIKDFFWYGKGFSLQIIPGAAPRIKIYTTKIEAIQQKHPILKMFLFAASCNISRKQAFIPAIAPALCRLTRCPAK